MTEPAAPEKVAVVPGAASAPTDRAVAPSPPATAASSAPTTSPAATPPPGSPAAGSASSAPPVSAAAAPPAAAEAPDVHAPTKIKEKRPTQRACDEKDAKGKVCCGHLKRWYDYPAEIEALIGKKAEIYRCEFCQTLYTPDLAEMPHSYTLRY
jgi:hypothetical protein